MKRFPARFATFLTLALLCLGSASLRAATFSGNASLAAGGGDSLSALAPNNALTVSCWFRMVIPTGTNLTENMVILMDRADGNENANFSYLIRFNIENGAIEFLARGTTGSYTNTLIARPFLDRWYHVAVVRANNVFSMYVDGRALTPDGAFVGTASGNGLSIGGVNGSSRMFRGDIVEAAIYRSALDAGTVRDRMFRDQRSFANLAGYYKLGYSTNSTDLYRNFAAVPPVGTDPASKQGSGTVDFEETDQAGEQSLFDSRKNHGDQALAPLSGAFSWSQTALSRPVPGIAFNFQFGYSSGTPTAAPSDGGIDPYSARNLGPGWRHTFDARLYTETSLTEFKLLTWDGSIETWVRTNGVFRTRHREYRGELVQLPDFNFEWTTPERLVYRFRDPTDGTVMAGRLVEIHDYNTNSVQLRWNEDEATLTNVVDTAQGNYRFRYNTALGLLTNVSFGAWQVNFNYDATNRLVSKSLTNTSGLYANINTYWQFTYSPSNGLLQSITDPRGITNLFVAYDKYGRKTNDFDALGRTNRTEYGVPAKRQIRHTDPAGFQWLETYDRKGRLLAQQDPLGNTTSHTYDDAGNRTSLTEPLGWTTFFGYDSRANVIARTNALGEITRWNFHSFFNKAVQEIDPLGWTNFYVLDNATGNLLQHYDALGTLVTYTYASNGLALTATDANGNLSRNTYDTNGFLIARTDPATNTSTFTYNDVGWKLSEANALGDLTTYTLNLNGNVTRKEDVLSRLFFQTYDAAGNLLSATDAKGQLTTYAYDAVNQRTQMVDRAGSRWNFTYTSRGKPATTTDPLTNLITQAYDAANRLVSATDPLGNSATNLYDASGNLITLIDVLGQRWTKTYDRLNRVIAELDPLGNARQTTFDSVGRIREITTPNGYPSTHTYDGRGRLTQWQDAEGFLWRYNYDGTGNITNITDALNGHYVMTYGPRNERLSEQNQDTNRWFYTYDELLRLKQQTDPNGTTRTVTYDPASRILSVAFNTGRLNTLTYDDNNNPRTITRRIGGVPTTTRMTYDVLDRVTEDTDAFQQVVGYGHDALGRITTLVYPGNKTLIQNFDALGRLTNQVDWAARQTSYTYDRAGRLLRRTYPNGVSQTNTFDSAGRITSLSYSALNSQPTTLNLALTYAYDRNGNKTGGGEQGTLAWPMPSLTDEKSSFTAAGKLKTRTVTTNATGAFPSPGGEGQGEGGLWTYKYDPSGNLTNATGGGQTWALTYDEDNRTTSLLWDAGLTAKIITNRYDALGRRIAKTVDNAETRYVLDVAGSMERILCDTDAAGNITAWYVHGLDLTYKVDASNIVTCFHADAQANIIALTGNGGTNLALYAYTPYGRSLGSTNSQSQISNPYLFVGSQGVMEELPGLYFMRARYYSVEVGMFFSTEPVKKIGPGWHPSLYAYGINNPLAGIDPNGKTFLKTVSSYGKSFVQTVSSVFQRTLNAVGHIEAKEAATVAKTTSKGGATSLKESNQPIQTSKSLVNGTIQSPIGGSRNLLDAGTERGRASFIERSIKQLRDQGAKTATENYVYKNVLVDILHKAGDSHAGEHSADALSAAHNVAPVISVIKGGYKEFGNRGFSLKDIASGWWNIGANIQFAFANPDQGLKSLKEGVDSATAVTINLATDIATGGYLGTDFAGDEIGDFTNLLGSGIR